MFRTRLYPSGILQQNARQNQHTLPTPDICDEPDYIHILFLVLYLILFMLQPFQLYWKENFMYFHYKDMIILPV